MRGKGEGTIYKRQDGRWAGQLTVDGVRKTFYGKSRKEVLAKITQAKADLAKGLPLPDEKQLAERYFADWLKGMALEVRPSTYERYSTIVRLHLIPGLGRIPLYKLNGQHIKNFYTDEAVATLKSLRLVHAVLHRALKDAVRMGLVPVNASEQINAPKVYKHEMQTLTEEQGRQYLETCAADRLEALFVLAITTGMRDGELRALRWSDVDFEDGKLTVRYTARDRGGRSLEETKTEHSRRTIGLSKRTRAALLRRKALYHLERLKAGQYWKDLNLVFGDELGNILTHHVTNYWHKKYLKAARLPDIRFHDLRHTAATIAIEHGNNIKAVSEMLGHSSVVITLQIYAHVTPHMQQAIVDTMDAVFGG